jgi:hypothetical protein
MGKAWAPLAAASATTRNSVNRPLQAPSSSNNDTIKVAIVAQQIITELRETV